MRLKKLIRNLITRLRPKRFHDDADPVNVHQTDDTKKKRKFFRRDLRKFILKRHKLPRYRKFDSEPANTARKSVRFANIAFDKDNKNNKDSCSASDPKNKGAKKHKRLRYLKRQARKAVEYLALGIAASGAGYGMPPGFNPTAFKSECAEYPEVYTLEQLRWMSNYKKNLYSVGHMVV